MAETSESKIARLTKDFGGYKQIAFWNTFVRVIFGLEVAITIIGMLVGIVFGVVFLGSGEDGNYIMSLGLIGGCTVGGLVIIFIQYMMLMLKQLLLSYLYDVKQQRITLENLTLLEAGEIVNDRNLTTFAARSALRSMNITSSGSER